MRWLRAVTVGIPLRPQICRRLFLLISVPELISIALCKVTIRNLTLHVNRKM